LTIKSDLIMTCWSKIFFDQLVKCDHAFKKMARARFVVSLSIQQAGSVASASAYIYIYIYIYTMVKSVACASAQST
jgi:hypothetical protein